MPRGDGTGPMGMGPMTGRALGYCAGYNVPGYANPVGFGLGRGMAWGRGGGFGRGLGLRRGWGAGSRQFAGYGPQAGAFNPAAPIDEEAALKTQLDVLEDQLAAVRRRLSEIEAQEKAE